MYFVEDALSRNASTCIIYRINLNLRSKNFSMDHSFPNTRNDGVEGGENSNAERNPSHYAFCNLVATIYFAGHLLQTNVMVYG